MRKYKKLYLEAQSHIETQNQLIGELNGYKAQLEEYSRMMQALQVENQRFLDENNKLMEQLSTAKAEIDKREIIIRRTDKTLEEKEKEIAELVDAMDKLQKASDAYIDGLKDSSRLTGECEGCRYDGVNVQKCGTCTRNPRAIDKYAIPETVKDEAPVPVKKAASDTAELLEGEAEVNDVPVATPVEEIVPPKAKDEDLKPAPKEKRQHKKFKGKGKKR